MEITYTCDCGQRLKVDYGDAGEVFECPACGGEAECPYLPVGEGVTIGGFFIHELLGAGAMGKVYKAEQRSLNRLVALKILASHLAWDEEGVARFFKEMRMAAKVHHTNLVAAYDAGEDNGLYYLAMEFVDGDNLEELLEDGYIDEATALKIVRSVAKGLRYAWEDHDMIHRDIKPANIMIIEGPAAKVLDLGLAKSTTNNDGLTLTGTVLGTPYYMSPEQVDAQIDIDCRTDIYSLGCTLYHMVTGVIPFSDSSADEAMQQQASGQLPDPRSHVPEISEGLFQLLVRMLARDPENRHKDWAAVEKDLKAVAEGGKPRWREDELRPIDSLLPYDAKRSGGGGGDDGGKGFLGRLFS